VTNFFRDAEAWEILKTKTLPALLAAHPAGGVLRAWVAGCSSGEEAYSLAIVFKEALAALKPEKRFTLNIFATDLDADAIRQARQGLFGADIAADISPQRLNRYFTSDEKGYRVNKDIRGMVVFAQQNVLMDPPFTRLDLLTCRNLLIYLNQEAQKKLIPLFHHSLRPGGALFLGSSESLSGCTGLFQAAHPRHKLFFRTGPSLRARDLEFPPALVPAEPVAREDKAGRGGPLQAAAERLILQRYAPAAVMTNDRGDILYVSGHTGKYLEPPAGKANWNILSMAREGLRAELADALQAALRRRKDLLRRGVSVGKGAGKFTVDLRVGRVSDPASGQAALLIVFSEAPGQAAAANGKGRGGGARLALLARQLQQARAEAQNTREEMLTSQEELQSSNEELQSTNEELTTSKEEMQSMNEEMQTVNAELQANVDQLARANNDMKNLLNSTDLTTVFLDDALLIKGFTVQATKNLKLRDGDIGRPITDISSELLYPELAEDAREVLRTLVISEKEIHLPDGRWFSARLLPYRTVDNVISGVVATFLDISASIMGLALRKTDAMLRALVDSADTVIVCLTPDMRVLEFNQAAEKLLGRRRFEVLGRDYLQAFIPEPARAAAAAEFRKILESGPGCGFAAPLRAADGVALTIRWNVQQLRDERGAPGDLIISGKVQG